MNAATDEDWGTEYLAPILAVRIVDTLDMAIEHGVSFDVGSRFAHELPPSPVTMRISFSNIGPLWIDEATSRLAKAFTAWSKAPKARPTSYIRELAPTRQSRAA